MVVRGWFLSLLVFQLDFSLVSCCPCSLLTNFTYFGLSTLLLQLLPLILGAYPLFAGGLAFQLTCMSEAALGSLTAAIHRLAAAIESRSGFGPAVLPAVPSSSTASGDITVFYPPSLPFATEVWIPHCQQLSFCGADTGPPEVPDFCLELGLQNLTGGRYEVETKVVSAFQAGFWARASVDCCVPYSQRKDSESGAILRHFVVLRSSHYEPFRVNTFGDLTSICDITDRQIVYESFSTFTEVQLFCAGAGREIPALKRWTRQL